MSISIIIAILLLLGGTSYFITAVKTMSRDAARMQETIRQTYQNTQEVLQADDREYPVDEEQHAADLRRSEKAEMLFRIFPAALMFADDNGSLLEANDYAYDIYHLQSNNGKLIPINIMFMEDDAYSSVVNPQTLQGPLHFCAICPDALKGKTRYIQKSYIPIVNEDGYVENVFCETRDLTDEREAQHQLMEEKKRLDEAYNRMIAIGQEIELLFRNHDIYLYTADWKNRKLTYYYNPTEPVKVIDFTELIDHMVGVDHAYLHAHEGELIDKFRQPYTSKIVIRNLMDDEDHTPHVVRQKSHPIVDQQGNMVGAYGVYFDITEAEKKREQLTSERELADMSAKQQSIFLSSMSHEIRTPLNGIVGFSQLLPMMEAKEERQEILDLIQSSCDTMQRLFDDIQDADTIGKSISILPKDVDFSKEFGNVCTMLSLRVTEPEVEYIVENPLQSLTLHLDMGRISQVIANFLTNAVKYTHQGHIKLGYTYSDAEGLYVFCEDTGTGIPKEKQASAFVQFVKLNDNVQGTGLGLNICKQIIEKSGGTIGLDSEEDKGCNFWFRLPAEIILPEHRSMTINEVRKEIIHDEEHVKFLVDSKVQVQASNYHTIYPDQPIADELLIGNILRCKNAAGSGRCGSSAKCKDCEIRNQVNHTIASHQGVCNVKVNLEYYQSKTKVEEKTVDVNVDYQEIDAKPYAIVSFNTPVR